MARRDFFENMAHKRAKKALQGREREFISRHLHADDAKLTAYLCRCAQEIGHVPAQIEVIGGAFIAERFGSWEHALQMAGMHPDGREPPLEKTRIFKEEVKRQKEKFLAGKAEKRRQKAGRAKNDSVREQGPDGNKENEIEREENDTDGDHRQGAENDRACKVD